MQRFNLLETVDDSDSCITDGRIGTRPVARVIDPIKCRPKQRSSSHYYS